MAISESHLADHYYQIDSFEKKYDYDANYMRELLDRSPASYEAFLAARPMTMFREELPLEAYFVAAITVMQAEDCGSCLELNVKMALEAGVGVDLVKSLLKSPENLSPELQDVREHVQRVSRNESPLREVLERIEASFGRAAVAELALCIASVRIYPILKRALLKQGECSIIDYSTLVN